MASEYVKKFQEYADSPTDNGFMDDVKLTLVERKKIRGEPLTEADKELLHKYGNDKTIAIDDAK